jgi:hypothetical protein
MGRDRHKRPRPSRLFHPDVPDCFTLFRALQTPLRSSWTGPVADYERGTTPSNDRRARDVPARVYRPGCIGQSRRELPGRSPVDGVLAVESGETATVPVARRGPVLPVHASEPRADGSSCPAGRSAPGDRRSWLRLSAARKGGGVARVALCRRTGGMADGSTRVEPCATTRRRGGRPRFGTRSQHMMATHHGARSTPTSRSGPVGLGYTPPKPRIEVR